ncbi:hypothetical protein POTOM_057994 [Populus tomentosa]|uniref:Transmembrane protein n=1 Tax=Populus tomentosa TaxID=118781 RepID=A0A8X8C0B8_POPTO|nr:hypothetical protein POTOM_057994 [Populus tomentosa]
MLGLWSRFFKLRFLLFILIGTVESSGSPESLDPSPQTLLQELSDCFDLPPDYFQQLPSDLRLDVSSICVLFLVGFRFKATSVMYLLNDAAFDLSNGPVLDECGKELGEILLNLSRAWELADTSTSRTLASKLPVLEISLTNNAKSGKNRSIQYWHWMNGLRVCSESEVFAPFLYWFSIWQTFSIRRKEVPVHGTIAKTMITTGKLLSASSTSTATDEEPKKETRVLKFGDLQIEITPVKANIGAVIGLVFGILSWELAQRIQSSPENSLEYANGNALLLAKSLRGTLLALCYSSTLLSACTTVGLFFLARQVKSKEN